MELSSIIKDGSIMESLENYALVDQLETTEELDPKATVKRSFNRDFEFWNQVIDEPEHC